MKNYKTNTETGFLMTIIPSKFYTKTHADRINKNTYLHRDKYLFGSVLFHDLNGKFVNGWKYERGKVVSKIRKNGGMIFRMLTDWFSDQYLHGTR